MCSGFSDDRLFDTHQLQSVVQLLETMSDAFFTCDRNFCFSYINQEAARIFGQAKERLIGRSIWETFPQFVQPEIRLQLHQAIAAQVTVNFEICPPDSEHGLEISVHPSQQGAAVWLRKVHERKHPKHQVRTPNEELELRVQERTAELTQAYHDAQQLSDNLEQRIKQRTTELYHSNNQLVSEIHDRQQTEAKLRQTANYLNIALRSAPITLYTQDLDLRYTWVHNPQPNYSVEQVLGKHDAELASQDTAEILTALKQQVLQTAVGMRQEVRVCVRDQVQYYDLTIDPLVDEHGEVAGITGAAVNITQLKQTEESLHQSNAILNAINQFTPTLVYVKDRQSRVILANPALLETLNLPESGVIGATALDFHHPREAAEQIMENDRQVMESGQTQQFEEVMNTPDGQRYYLSVKSPYWDEQGNVIGLIGFSTDITKRKQTEALLQASQAALQQQLAEIEAIYQSAPIGLNVLDKNLRFVRINQQLAEMNGVSIAHHIGRTIREVLPDLAETAEAIMQSILMTGEPLLNVEIRGETPAQPGVERIWLEHFLPLKDDRGNVIGISTVCEEITERRRAEEALRASEERLRLAQKAARAGAWDWQISTNTVLWSEAYYELYGLDPQVQPSFDRWIACIYPDDQDIVIKQTSAALDHADEIDITFRVLHPQGLRWFNAVGQIFRNPDGQAVRMTGITLDVTERKQIELEREKLLRREQQAREQAEQANRVKDEFLAILSHELRTPLNPILGWAKLLQTSKFSEEKIHRALATIERNAKLQVQLIDDLLDISRILRGKLSLNLEPVSLVSVIGAALETVRLSAETKDIELEADLDPQVGFVRGDSGRLQQVVWNLLTNAIKFTPTGGRVAVRLEQGEAPAPHAFALITVTDTGKGIKPDFLPYIFEYFRQEDSSTTRQFGGLGLGLAISRQLVEAHGGTIAAANDDAHGASFTVRLPTLNEAAATTSAPPTGSFDLTGIRVLAVDDEPDSLDLLQSVLITEGAEVTVTSSVLAALQALERSPFDVIISDIGMPGKSGYELIELVRASSSPWRNLPAIALTAYASEEDKQRSQAAGFQSHLSKPIDAELIAAAILQLIASAPTP